MTTSRQIIALLRSHIEGDRDQFLSVALQAAAKEARQGHTQIAQEIRDLVDTARGQPVLSGRSSSPSASTPIIGNAQESGLGGLLSISQSGTTLNDLVLESSLEQRLRKVVLEHRQRDALLFYNFAPRSKLLLVGPPGTGKTITARALAGELHLPLCTVMLEGLITKFMGETAAKLRLIFDEMDRLPGVYFFDEFDAIGASRAASNDVGEMRRILNSFLQMLEGVSHRSLVIAATNHPELLDPALFRRFDDTIEYALPSAAMALKLLQTTLAFFNTKAVKWTGFKQAVVGLSHAEIVKIASEAAKIAILNGRQTISNTDLNKAFQERSSSHLGASR
jgi:AAA+ superfamily predicted ATPase